MKMWKYTNAARKIQCGLTITEVEINLMDIEHRSTNSQKWN